MALKKHAALVFSFVAALFLDTAVLPKWNLFSMVPFVMLACMLAAEQVFSIQTAILIGARQGRPHRCPRRRWSAACLPSGCS